MATFLARMTVREDGIDTFEEAAAELHRLTHEREEGVLRYEYWRGNEPGAFYTFASFRDAEAFIAHQVSEHHVALAGGVMMKVIEDFDLQWIEPVGQLGIGPATRPMQLTGDEDETTLEYHRRFPVARAAWWER